MTTAILPGRMAITSHCRQSAHQPHAKEKVANLTAIRLLIGAALLGAKDLPEPGPLPLAARDRREQCGPCGVPDKPDSGIAPGLG